MKQCYYELLEVDSKATDIELKKLYRKKALRLHPDKNPDNVEEATAQFNLVRAAYEVLSDPQERAWYDSHKNQILMEDEDYGDGNEDTAYEFAGTTTLEILRYFDPSLYSRTDDTVYGIYQVAGTFFDKLAREEVAAGKQQQIPGFDKYKDDTAMANAVDADQLLFPRFGNSKADYGSQVRVFYQRWSQFQTVKTFSWKDEYRYSRAQDRRTRRLMEKENKKARENAKREYNELVRSFVSFIKKRDERVKVGVAEYERSRKLKEQEERKRQLLRDREANRAALEEYEAQNWQNIDHEELAEIELELVKLHEEELKLAKDEKLEQDLQIYECIICDKVFKTASQFQTHERSKRHIKLLKKLQWEMRKEGIELGFDQLTDEEEFETAESDIGEEGEEGETVEGETVEGDIVESERVSETVGEDQDSARPELEIDDNVDSDSDFSSVPSTTRKQSKKKKKKKQQRRNQFGTSVSEFNSDAEPDGRDEELNRLLQDLKLDSSDDDWDLDNSKKAKGKAKGKKKKSTTASPSPSVTPSAPLPTPVATEECTVCGETFSSRNKLFQHVNSTGHALAPKGKKKQKKRK